MYRNVVTEMSPDRNGQTEVSRNRRSQTETAQTETARPKNPVPYQSSRWSYNCFEQLPLHFRVRCAFCWDLSHLGFLKSLSAWASHVFRYIGPRHVCLGPPVVFQISKLQITRWWPVKRSAPVMLRTSNYHKCTGVHNFVDAKNVCPNLILLSHITHTQQVLMLRLKRAIVN